jgi:glycosyltransferase involved in cell wall biosynthesis
LLTILLVVPELDTGGVERATLDVARAIVENGARAIVATKGGRMEGQLRATGAEMLQGPYQSKNPLTMWRNAARLAEVIKREKVAIIHAQSRAPAWSAMWAARRTGIKFVTTYAGIHSGKSAIKRWYNSIMAAADIVIANSAYTARHIRDTYPHLRRPIAVIPRGIDLTNFNPETVKPETVAALRARWLVPEGKPIVMMPGRLTRWKGPLTFIEAMALIKDLGAFGILAGDAQSRDGFEDEVLAHISRMGLLGQMRYVGHVNDMPAAYAAADVVVSASLQPEAFGRIAVEAQAMRRLIVATELGAARETVLPDVAGWLIPPESPQSMADAIATALTLEPAEAEAMRDRGRAHVLRKFDVTVMCRQTLQVYAKVLGQGTK